MSLLLTSLLVGTGILVGRMISRSPDKKPAPAEPKPETPPEPAAKMTPNLDAFPCRLGDVVLRSATSDEAWLAGALVLHEGDAPAAALFFSPEAGGDRAVLARPSQNELLWLSDEKKVTVPLGEPPTALEIGTDRFERRRRLPLRAERIGTGAPDLAADVIFAEYTGLGDDALVVLATKDRVLAYRGPSLSSGAYDVLPGNRERET
ncbi:MAG TPA: hypothetical protein VGH28_19680 [Polyangiaceae bacterium]|jgi:hypothetical protein